VAVASTAAATVGSAATAAGWMRSTAAVRGMRSTAAAGRAAAILHHRRIDVHRLRLAISTAILRLAVSAAILRSVGRLRRVRRPSLSGRLSLSNAGRSTSRDSNASSAARATYTPG